MKKVSLIQLLKSYLYRKVLIILIIFLHCSGAVFSQDGYNNNNLNQNGLLIFYSNPDEQDLSNAWNYIVQTGLSQAAFWEEEQYNNELLNRLLDWSGTKLKETLPLPDIFEFLKTIDEANLSFL